MALSKQSLEPRNNQLHLFGEHKVTWTPWGYENFCYIDTRMLGTWEFLRKTSNFIAVHSVLWTSMWYPSLPGVKEGDQNIIRITGFGYSGPSPNFQQGQKARSRIRRFYGLPLNNKSPLRTFRIIPGPCRDFSIFVLETSTKQGIHIIQSALRTTWRCSKQWRWYQHNQASVRFPCYAKNYKDTFISSKESPGTSPNAHYNPG